MGMIVLEFIGNAWLVPRRKMVSEECGEIWVKLEWKNPTGGMKNRLTRAVIERAEGNGRLRTGGTVVEYTGGSTGASLALVCAAKGHRLRILTSRAFSAEKRRASSRAPRRGTTSRPSRACPKAGSLLPHRHPSF
jgi:cysteine synthase A